MRVSFLLAIVSIISISLCHGGTYKGCIGSERQALLRFKQSVTDPSNRLLSWINDRDCCLWKGVVCDHLTGNILQLHLQNLEHDGIEAYTRNKLMGTINSSLLDLKHLVSLNLSRNGFMGIIPTFFGSMKSLRYLDLSANNFEGMIPHQLGNLSNLQYLDLQDNTGDLRSNAGLYVENFQWLSNLSLLKHLDLSGVDLSKVSDWLQVTNSLPSLIELRLAYCELSLHLQSSLDMNFSSLALLDLNSNQLDNTFVPSWVFSLTRLRYLDISHNNFHGPIPRELRNLTLITHLDLSYNQFNSSIPEFLYRFSNLEYLSLSDNSLKGTISYHLGNLTSITRLELSNNELEGKIPRSFSRLCNLKYIDFTYVNLSQNISEILDIFSGCVSVVLETVYMSGCNISGHLTTKISQFKNLDTLFLYENSISGPIPPSIGALSSLKYLYLANNKIGGTLSEIHFLNLTRLLGLILSENSISFNVSSSWIPPFQLEILSLSSCPIGPSFPIWIRSQKHLVMLDISNSKIVDSIPDWFRKYPLPLRSLNLSHNQMSGKIPDLTNFAQLASLDLSSNKLSGPLPLIPSYATIVILSNNTFSGSISHFLCGSETNGSQLQMLNVANNLLSGEIPDCWKNFRELMYLVMDNNNFTSNLPISMGTLGFLQVLQLSKNHLSGIVPLQLGNCTELLILDLSENEFVGNIPTWIGEKLSKIKILNLHANNFDGFLPIELCRLASLQSLDLANNNLSGSIPICIGNFSAMAAAGNSSAKGSIDIEILWNPSTSNMKLLSEFPVTESLVTKGERNEYGSILNLMRTIDLSSNNFTGKIPIEVTKLRALVSLNLSHNYLAGRIPKTIGNMKKLETIDFSRNQLSGEIPQSISELSFLGHLNLSYNNLSGIIPTCTQIQTLDATSFLENKLCGTPLSEVCHVSVPEDGNEEGKHDEDDEDVVPWFYLSMAFGFVVGFWGVVGPIFFSRRWRYTYYDFLEYLGYKFIDVIRKCW